MAFSCLGSLCPIVTVKKNSRPLKMPLMQLLKYTAMRWIRVSKNISLVRQLSPYLESTTKVGNLSDYKKAMQIDAQQSIKYFNFSLSKKTEQQKALEKILIEKGVAPQIIADIACGGGGGKCASC